MTILTHQTDKTGLACERCGVSLPHPSKGTRWAAFAKVGLILGRYFSPTAYPVGANDSNRTCK